MVLDSSAIISVILKDAHSLEMMERMQQAPVLGVGAPTLLETAMVLASRFKREARQLLNRFLAEAQVEIIPFGRDHLEIALDAFERYGKGRHPAALNFGDCLTYAVARLSGLPLLYTGEDFSKTDLGAVS